jgi:hypothetical protein
VLADSSGIIGLEVTATNNVVTIAGGSVWNNSTSLSVGVGGSGNQLIVSTNGIIIAPLSSMGKMVASTNNSITLTGGSLFATNAALDGALILGEAGNGTLNFNGGVIETDRLLRTNAQSVLNFNSGTLRTRNTLSTNGSLFVVGDGASPAMVEYLGSGPHIFTTGMLLRTNAVVRGNGIIGGPLTVQSGAVLSPGLPIGKLTLSNSPSLQGTLLMELSKNVLDYQRSTSSAATNYLRRIAHREQSRPRLARGGRIALPCSAPRTLPESLPASACPRLVPA